MMFSQVMPFSIFSHRLGTINTAALGINASGHIVGVYLAGSGYNGFLYRGGTYIMAETFANGINALGQIVGTCVEKTAKSFKLHGFFYTHGLYATFDHPTHWINPTGINVAGHIVGWYNGAPDGFLYINGLYATVDHPLTPSDTSVGGINDNGQIIGSYDKNGVWHGYLLKDGTYTTIDHPSATQTILMGINNNGQIVGQYADSTGSFGRGFLCDPSGGTFTTINFPTARHSSANGINNNGQIVGHYYDSSGPFVTTHGFLYDPNSGTYTSLDVP
jgi:probable HAF family extracellular repeat protein